MSSYSLQELYTIERNSCFVYFDLNVFYALKYPKHHKQKILKTKMYICLAYNPPYKN